MSGDNMIAVMMREPGSPPRAKASAALAPNRVGDGRHRGDLKAQPQGVHEVARGEEFFEPAQ